MQESLGDRLDAALAHLCIRARQDEERVGDEHLGKDVSEHRENELRSGTSGK